MALEGIEILEELPGDLSGLLWDSLRNVTLWARAPERTRERLFVTEAAAQRLEDLENVAVPELVRALVRQVAALLARPGQGDPGGLSEACKAVSRWAWDEGYAGTAIAFMQAATFVRPADAAAAKEVGRMTRLQGDGARAESWFLYAIDQGRQSQDWESYALAYIGLGNLYGQRGRLPSARRALLRALRASRRHGHQNVEAMASHDLFVIAAAGGRVPVAERYAITAAERYGPGHPRLPVLAQDLAFLWMENGDFESALKVFDAVRTHVHGFPEELLLVSAAARAAAGSGLTKQYQSLREEAERMIPQREVQEGVAPAFLNLAHAAASRGEWSRAAESAERARRIAAKTGEGKMRLAAEGVLDQVARARVLATWTGVTVPGGRTSTSAERTASEICSLLGAGVR